MDYASAISFLKVVSTLSSSLPEGIPNRLLFEAYADSLPNFENGDCRKASAVFLTKFAKVL